MVIHGYIELIPNKRFKFLQNFILKPSDPDPLFISLIVFCISLLVTGSKVIYLWCAVTIVDLVNATKLGSSRFVR